MLSGTGLREVQLANASAASRSRKNVLYVSHEGGDKEMRKPILHVSAILIILSLALAACGGAATEAPAAAPAGVPEVCGTDPGGCAVFAPGEAIKIGFAGPMSGDVSAFGIDASQGIAIALTDAGQFEGHPFEQVAEDDQASPEVAATVAQRFASDKTVVAIVGHLFSGATNAAMPIYAEAYLPMMSPSATRIDLTTLGSPVFNRNVGNDKVQGELAANFIYGTLGAKKLALIHDGGAYGLGLAERARDVYTSLGGTVVAFQGIETGATDYSAVLADIASKGPEAIFFGGYTGEAAVIANQKAGAGMGAIPFISDDGIYGTQFIDLAGANSEGVYCTSAGRPSASTAVADFDAKYLAAWGVPTGSLSPYSWYSYTAAAVLVDAVKKTAIVSGDGNLYIPRDALVKAVRGTSGYQGLIGEITCDPTGECGTGGFALYKVVSGAWIELAAGEK
jgi:branched-chain amino acid transport system substrate-binding protein